MPNSHGDANPENTHPPFDFKLFLISRKTDIIAVIALITSIFNFFIVALLVFVEPTIEQLVPKNALLWGYKNDNNHRYLAVSADLAYVNRSNKTQNAIIKGEKVIIKKIRGPACDTELNIVLLATYHEDTVFDGTSIKRTNSRSALPRKISGMDVETHGTTFFPYELDCRSKGDRCNKWKDYEDIDDFVEKLKTCQSSPEDLVAVVLAFITDYYDAAKSTTQCEIYIVGEAGIANFTKPERVVSTIDRSSLEDTAKTSVSSIPSETLPGGSYGWVNRTCFPVIEKKSSWLNIF